MHGNRQNHTTFEHVYMERAQYQMTILLLLPLYEGTKTDVKLMLDLLCSKR